ncbi:MarR family transcriptional regulator [Acidobacteria bacterium AB60]|nr:MarR family transcriptional regulator [Acidobacteria bacterium AB60]
MIRNELCKNDQIREKAQAGVIAVAEQIRAHCSVITKAARADLDGHLKRQDSGISAIEHGVLRHLSRGVTSMAEISRLMGVAPSTLVYVVDGLTAKKLVKRGKDPADRRKEPLLLEKKGAALFAKYSRMDAESALVRSLKAMPDARRTDLLALLQELVHGLTGSERLYLNAGDSATASRVRDEDKETKS